MKRTTNFMPRGESFINQKAVLERRSERMGLKTEKDLLTFIHEHEGTPGWEQVREKWGTERERGILPLFEQETVRALKADDANALETARAFIHYFDNQARRNETKTPVPEPILPQQVHDIRDYVTSVTSDRELAAEISKEFDNELSDCSLNGVCEKLLRRMEIFIDDCVKKIDTLRSLRKQDDLWRLQLTARAIRNNLLRHHFENPETH